MRTGSFSLPKKLFACHSAVVSAVTWPRVLLCWEERMLSIRLVTSLQKLAVACLKAVRVDTSHFHRSMWHEKTRVN